MENSITLQIAEKREIKVRKGQFVKGHNSPGPGRPKLTEEEKIIKKTVKEWLKEHEEGLAEALPEVRPALIAQAKKGNIKAIREIHEVVGAHKNKGGNVVVPVQINFSEDKEKYG